jgi:TusA-related sulfurtransferase
MSIIVDAGGLSCPQPVLMTLDKIKEIQKGEILIKVDTDTSKENVSRAAQSQGWEIADVQEDEGGYQLTIKKCHFLNF